MSYFEHDDALRSMIRRARVAAVDDSGTQQILDLKGLAGDAPAKVFRPQAHGFSSHPVKDSEGLLLALGGRSDRLVYLDGGHKEHRPKDSAEGSATLYDKDGNVLSATAKDGIAIDAAKGKVTVRSKDGNVEVAGKKIYLGGDGTDGTYARVMTESGPSSIVYAKV